MPAYGPTMVVGTPHSRFGLACALLLLASASLFSGCSSSPRNGADGATAAPLPPGEFRPTEAQWNNLSIVPVSIGSVGPALLTDGQIAADDDRTTQMFSPFSGRITRIFVSPGARVRKGQPLYAIAASELVQGRSDVATAEAALAAARKAFVVAQANATRQQALIAVQGAALRDVQQAQADLENARSNVAAGEAQRAAAKGRLSILDLDGHGVRLQRDEAVVRSPIAGIVTARMAGIGQYVQSAAGGASSPLFTISDLSRVWLVANVREADAAWVRRGAELRVQVPAFPHRSFAGRIYYVAPAVDPNTRRIVVRAEIANPDGALRPNMFADASVSGGPARPAATVPAQAVLYEDQGAHVWIAHPERHSLSLRQIQTGASVDGAVTVTRGLRAGDHIVTAGSVFIDRANGAS